LCPWHHCGSKPGQRWGPCCHIFTLTETLPVGKCIHVVGLGAAPWLQVVSTRLHLTARQSARRERGPESELQVWYGVEHAYPTAGVLDCKTCISIPRCAQSTLISLSKTLCVPAPCMQVCTHRHMTTAAGMTGAAPWRISSKSRMHA
jgi:hypothetical protein